MHARSFLHTNAAHWTTIKTDTPNILALAFASELKIAVAVSCVKLPVSACSFSSGRTPIYSCRIGHLPYRPPENDGHDQLPVLQYWQAAPIGISTQFGGFCLRYIYTRAISCRGLYF